MLRPRKRMRRQEIQEDALVTAYVNAQKFYRRNSRYIHIGLAAAAGIILIAVLAGRSKAQAEAAAAERLGVLEYSYYMGNHQEVVERMPEIVETYPGTKAAGKAAFFTADSYLALENYEKAEEYYTLCYEDYRHMTLFAPSSLAGIAACREAAGKYGEAAEYYLRAARLFDDHFQRPFHLENAGRCFAEIGDTARAEETFTDIAEKYPDYRFIDRVTFRRESLTSG